MKATLAVLAVLICVLTDLHGADTSEVNRARTVGAKGQITFHTLPTGFSKKVLEQFV